MINRTSLHYENDLNRRLPQAERAIRDLKNRQTIGIESLEVVRSINSFSVTIPAGGIFVDVANFVGTALAHFNSELGVWTFVDTDADPTYLWPTGLNITPGRLLFQRSVTYDAGLSDELGAGRKTYIIELHNLDSISHTYYQNYVAQVPKGALPS